MHDITYQNPDMEKLFFIQIKIHLNSLCLSNTLVMYFLKVQVDAGRIWKRHEATHQVAASY